MISCYLSFKLFKKLQVIIFPFIFFLVKKFQDLFLLFTQKWDFCFSRSANAKRSKCFQNVFSPKTKKTKSDILSNFFFLEGNWCKTLWVAFKQTNNKQQLFYICKQTNNLTFAVNCLNQKLKFLHQIISVPLNLNISSSKSNQFSRIATLSFSVKNDPFLQNLNYFSLCAKYKNNGLTSSIFFVKYFQE